jgi:hypothetical protein
MQARSTTTAESVAKARPTSKFGYNPVADRIIESCTRSATDQRPRTSKMPINRFEGQSLLFERLSGIAVLSFLFVAASPHRRLRLRSTSPTTSVGLLARVFPEVHPRQSRHLQ